MFNVVSIKQRYAGHSRQAGHILSQCGVGAYMSRYSVVVDEDIDPSNLQEVMWAVATRSDPAIDIDIIHRGMGSKNDPMFVAYPYDALDDVDVDRDRKSTRLNSSHTLISYAVFCLQKKKRFQRGTI